jgi:hypothetical protein
MVAMSPADLPCRSGQSRIQGILTFSPLHYKSLLRVDFARMHLP